MREFGLEMEAVGTIIVEEAMKLVARDPRVKMACSIQRQAVIAGMKTAVDSIVTELINAMTLGAGESAIRAAIAALANAGIKELQK